MTTPADVFDVRRLVDQAVALEAPPARHRHVVGLAIDRKKSFAHPAGRVPLPTYDGGLTSLRAAVAGPVLELSTGDRDAAWAALLGTPGLVVPLEVPDDYELLESGVVVPAGVARERLRRIGLAVVTTPSERDVERTLPYAAFAGVARLTVQMRAGGQASADNAWLHAHWVTSAGQLTQMLESLAPQALLTARRATRRTLVVVVAESMEARVDAETVERLDRTAEVLDMNLTLFRRATNNFEHVLRAARDRPPAFLVIVGPFDAEAERLFETHRTSANGVRQTTVDLRNTDADALGELRVALTRLAGVTAGLELTHSFDLPPPPPARPRIPLVDPGDCLHDEWQRPYIEDISTNLWWTRDTANHAGSEFKTYRKQNQTLIHEACRDRAGAVVDKHKGEAGRNIQLTRLTPCGGPPHLGG